MRAVPESKRITTRSPSSRQTKVFFAASSSSLPGLSAQAASSAAMIERTGKSPQPSTHERTSRHNTAQAAQDSITAHRAARSRRTQLNAPRHTVACPRARPPVCGVNTNAQGSKPSLTSAALMVCSACSGQRRLAGEDAAITQRRVSDDQPTVIGAKRDHDRLAPERIPPDAEKMHRGHLEHRRQRGIERTRLRLVGLDAAVRAQAADAGRDGAIVRCACIPTACRARNGFAKSLESRRSRTSCRNTDSDRSRPPASGAAAGAMHAKATNAKANPPPQRTCLASLKRCGHGTYLANCAGTDGCPAARRASATHPAIIRRRGWPAQCAGGVAPIVSSSGVMPQPRGRARRDGACGGRERARGPCARAVHRARYGAAGGCRARRRATCAPDADPLWTATLQLIP